jgi:hypothetical protein
MEMCESKPKNIHVFNTFQGDIAKLVRTWPGWSLIKASPASGAMQEHTPLVNLFSPPRRVLLSALTDLFSSTGEGRSGSTCLRFPPHIYISTSTFSLAADRTATTFLDTNKLVSSVRHPSTYPSRRSVLPDLKANNMGKAHEVACMN